MIHLSTRIVLGGEVDATGMEQEYGHELLTQLDKLH